MIEPTASRTRPLGALPVLAAALALGTAAAPVAAVVATAAAPDTGSYRFLFDTQGGTTLAETYGRNHDQAGIPLALDPHPVAVDAALMARIAEELPEGKDLRKTARNLVAAEDAAVLHLVEDTEVWITFLHEGTNRHNSFGYFTYEDGRPPKDPTEVEHVVILPNASFSNGGGDERGLRTGQRIHLGRFPAHTRVGFFIINDGWHKTTGIDPTRDTFYSLTTLNPEHTGDDRKHMTLLRDAWSGHLVLGMEETLRSDQDCDHDFNDILFAVETATTTAVDTTLIPELTPSTLGDLDGDGVADSLDDYPNDATMTTRVAYPSDQGRAQLAFEDMWPYEGDYDLNDLVLTYALEEGRDAGGGVREIAGEVRIKARGAGYSHGFGLHFANLPADALESASVWVDGQAAQPLVSEPGQSKLTLVLFADSKALADKNTNTRTCYTTKFNADKNCPHESAPAIHFRARFKQAHTREEVGAAPYNPFIYIVGDRKRETHLPDQPPTALANVKAFGSGNEGSVPALGRYYKTKDRSLPWAVNIPAAWPQPYEKNPVHTCYPTFVEWVNSSGGTGSDWYRNPLTPCVFPAQ